MRALIKALAFLVLLVAVLWFLSETFLPAAASKAVEQSVATLIGHGSETKVDLRAKPAVKILTGRVDHASIHVKNLIAGGLTVDSLDATIDNLEIDPVAILRNREVALSSATNLAAAFRVSEADLAKYLATHLREISDLKVTVTGGKATAAGNIALSGQRLAITLEGVFRVRSHTKVGLDATGASVAGVSIPKALLDQILTATGWTADLVDFGSLPVPMQVEDVRMESGFLVVRARAARVTP